MTEPRIFISYARSDGFDYSQQLRTRLDEAEIPVWQDLVAMNIGENWMPQIFSAIETAKALVMILTPAALKSPMVRQEWVHARRMGTPIFPVAFSDIYKETDVPRWVQKVDALILDSTVVGSEQKWASFLTQLRNPKQPNKIPNMVLPLRDEYVERTSLHKTIVHSLLDDDATSPRHKTGSHYVTLMGEGGFGKTTLAQAVGLEININEAFTGGVLWATIGESATQLTEKWNAMLAALTGSDQPHADPLLQLKLRLQGDDYLIILDDVWDRAHIEPVLRFPRCTYLITTRDVGVAALAVDPSARHAVAEMTPDEAQAVLMRYLPPDHLKTLPDIQKADLKTFAAQLGEWPLLLDIHGWAIREECQRGSSVKEALTYVRDGLAEEGLDPFPRGSDDVTRRRTLAGSMNASLRRYDDAEKQRLYELAIFPEDTPIPEATVLMLWHSTAGMSNFAVRKLLRRIAGHFCRFRSEEVDAAPVVHFHDKIREYLAKQLTDTKAVHGRLIDAWGDAYTLPDEFAWRWYAYHLIGAGQNERLRELLLDFRWLQAKLGATDGNALVADCEFFTDDKTMRLLKSAFSMSLHVLVEDKTAMPHQLVGRLMSHRQSNDEIHTLTDALMTLPGVYPANPDSKYAILNQAGGTLLRTLSGHTGGVIGARQLVDGRLLSWSYDGMLRLWGADGTPITTLHGHTAGVGGAMQLSDGRLLSWSYDETLRLWGADGTPITVLSGHTGIVNRAMQLSDGRLLSWSSDGTLRLWRADGTPITTLHGHTAGVGGAMQLADGRLLSLSSDGTLRLWDADGTSVTALDGHIVRVNGALALADGRLLSWSRGGKLRLWERDGTPITTLHGHTAGVGGAMQLSDGRLLSWSYDGTLRLWERDGTPITTLHGHTAGVRGAMQLSDGRLLSLSSDGTLRLWDADGTAITTLHGHTDEVRGVMALSDGHLLSWGGNYKLTVHTLQMWDADGTAITTLHGHTDKVQGAMALADGRLLSWSDDHTLRLWDADGTAITALSGHRGWVLGTLALANGRLVSWTGGFGSTDHTLRLWNTTDGKRIATLHGHTSEVSGALALADGRLLSWSDDHTLRLWNTTDGKHIATLHGHTETVNGALALADGRLLSWSDDRTLRLWHASDGRHIATLHGHTSGVRGAMALANGRLLSWSNDGTLYLREKDGRHTATLHGHTGEVRGAMALADDRLLTWSDNGTLRLWDTDGTAITTLHGHTGLVRGVMALTDGRLLSWSNDGTLRLWDADGAVLAVMEGHTAAVSDALALPDGRLLSLSNDDTVWLWKANGTPLDRLNDVYYSGNREPIYDWARGHGFDADVLYADDDPALDDDYRVRSRWQSLEFYRRSDGVTVATFHADAGIACVTTIPEKRLIVAGDTVGRVMFLRLVE